MDFIEGIHGTVAAVFIVALLFVDEMGVPLPFAPNEALLLVSGLLISTADLNPWLFCPLAYLALVGGMLTGYGWARALGTDRLRAIAERVHAERAFDRATLRLRRAAASQIFVTRLIPGIRTYATLVAGAAEVDARTFLTGAVPALAVWETIMVGLGAAVGLPAEHYLGEFQRLAVSGVVLIVAAVASWLAIRRIPPSERAGPMSSAPGWQRVALALCLDVGVIATLVAGLDSVTRSILRTTRLAGLSGLAILIAVTVVAYVTATRRGPGSTAGEGVFEVSYLARLKR
ncbi:MAG TPA: DedA family protein [Candidatus Dormibacteraeota bacterium]|nr:DedA family protein [Candidatus Dormibacteraeota bacterium]